MFIPSALIDFHWYSVVLVTQNVLSGLVFACAVGIMDPSLCALKCLGNDIANKYQWASRPVHAHTACCLEAASVLEPCMDSHSVGEKIMSP